MGYLMMCALSAWAGPFRPVRASLPEPTRHPVEVG